MQAHWYDGEYMSGWKTDYSMINTSIARYMDGWGTYIPREIMARLVPSAPAMPKDGDTVTFEQADIERVTTLIRQAKAEREIRQARENAMVLCACGHTVPRSEVMMASMGSSCPDCYDRMSD